MLLLKEGVVLEGTKYINAILAAVQTVYSGHEWPVTITAGRDGVHSTHSYHYQGRAVDVRFWDVPEGDRERVAQEIRDKLAHFYDVVVESDHYHIEADRKRENLR